MGNGKFFRKLSSSWGRSSHMLCIYQKFYTQSRVKSNPECCLLGPVLVSMVRFLDHLPWWPPWTCANDQRQGPASSPGMAFSDTHSLEDASAGHSNSYEMLHGCGSTVEWRMLKASQKCGWYVGPLKEQPQLNGWRPQRDSKRSESHLRGRGAEGQ